MTLFSTIFYFIHTFCSFFFLSTFGYQKAHNNLGQLLHRSRRYDLAEHHYRAAIEILPTYHLALFNLATLLHTTGASIQQPHSMDTRDGGVGSKASSPLSPNSRSMSWSSQEEALSLYRASIDVMPRMPEVSVFFNMIYHSNIIHAF